MWLLRSGASSVNPLAKQGREDNFGRTEATPLQPWKQWGVGSPASISGGKLHLDYNFPPGWFDPTPEGGWNHEFQALTPNWEYKFNAQLFEISKSGSDQADEGLELFIGPGWTSNLVPSNQRFTLCVKVGHWTSGSKDKRKHHFGVRLQFRDKDTWPGGDQGGKTWAGFTSTTVDAAHTYTIRFFEDKTIVVAVDNRTVMCYDIPATGDWPNYRPGPNKRCVAFRMNQAKADVWAWSCKDYKSNPMANASPTAIFSDNFNRSNSTTLGNGWTAVGSAMEIIGNSMGIGGFFPADGYRGAWRSAAPLPSGHMYLGVIFGGDQGMQLLQGTRILGRMNSAGNGSCIAAEFYTNHVALLHMTGAINSPSFPAQLSHSSEAISTGTWYALFMRGDFAWVVDQNGNLLGFYEGINAIAPETQRYYGASYYRSLSNDSPSIDDYLAATVT